MKLLNRATRLLGPAAAVALLMTGTGVAAASEDTTTDPLTTTPSQVQLDPLTYLRPGNGFTGAVANSDGVRFPAMSYILNSNGTEVTAFCVEFGVDIDKKAEFTPTAWTESGIENFAKVADIAARHLEIGTPLSDPRREDLATQVAIWKLTDNVRADSTQQADITKRARELGANAANAVSPSWNLDVTPEVTVNGTGSDTVFTVDAKLSLDGQPVVGSAVQFSVGERNLVEVSDESGVAKVELPARFAGEEVVVSASTLVPAGVFLKASNGQSVVTASSTPVTVKGTATLAEVTPTPEPTPTATPTPEPTNTTKPKPTKPGKEEPDTKPAALPTTGADTNPLPVFALLAVAGAGIAVFFVSRRRR